MKLRCRSIAAEHMISRQDIETFRSEGFVIKRGLLAEQARQLAEWTDEIAGWPELPGVMVGAMGVRDSSVDNDHTVAKAGVRVLGEWDLPEHPWRT